MSGWFARLSAFIRARRTLEGVTAVLAALAVAILSTLAVDDISFLTSADRFVQDWQIAFKTPPERDQDPNIRIIAFDEEAMQHFHYRSPLDRGALADVLAALDEKGARVIVLDYLFDQKTEPEKDAKLKAVLRAMRTPVVVSYFEAGTIMAQDQTAYLNDFVPHGLRALPNLGTDQTDTVRWINPGGRTSGGEYLLSVQRRAAQIAGVATPNVRVPIVWRSPPGANQKVFSQLTACVQGIPNCLPITRILPKAVFKDKVVLIGSDLNLVDQHRTPFATDPSDPRATMPGVQILAYGIAQFIEHREPPQLLWWQDFLIALAFAGLGAALGLLDLSLWLRGAVVALLIGALWYLGAFLLYERAGILIGLVAPTLALVVSFALVDSITGFAARRQREFIRTSFGLYLAPMLVQQLEDDPSKLKLGGSRREMSLLFSDIAGFTTMAEGLDSEDVGRLLNDYLDGMTSAVKKHEGFVDKFIGDAVFAIFNAPADVAEHAAKCVRCMLDLDTFTEEFRARKNAEGIPLGLTRIGGHTGTAAVGNFGSRDKFSYTASGDAVNAASRLEGLNKTFGTRLCVSGQTRMLCKGIAFRPIGSVILKGKTEALDVFEPLHDGAYDAGYLARYAAAFDAAHDGHPDAVALFAELAKDRPDDPLAHFYLERLGQGETGTKIKMTEK
jgi:adenylate cyclase